MECGDAGEDEEGNKDEGKLSTDLSNHKQIIKIRSFLLLKIKISYFDLIRTVKILLLPQRSNSCSNNISVGTLKIILFHILPLFFSGKLNLLFLL